MRLFGKKKEETTCGCGGKCVPETREAVETEAFRTGILVLGSGCEKCNSLEEVVKEALQELHMDTTIAHVSDYAEIAAYGVMSTPALVVDGKVVSYGKILKRQEVIEILQKARS